jgi:hypothetical protein
MPCVPPAAPPALGCDVLPPKPDPLGKRFWPQASLALANAKITPKVQLKRRMALLSVNLNRRFCLNLA